MDILFSRESAFRRINRIAVALYYLFSFVLIVRYSMLHDGYHLGISLGTLVVPPAVLALYRLMRLRRAEQLDFLILAFAFLSYSLGACLDLYRVLPGYDKIAHTLSGVLVGLLCLPLYYALKPGHAIERCDRALAMCFVFFGSMAVAGLWEVGEYVLSFLTGLDLQRATTTGVGDSMQDMIVCLIGTLAVLPCAHRLTGGRRGVLSGAVEAFVLLNFPPES